LTNGNNKRLDSPITDTKAATSNSMTEIPDLIQDRLKAQDRKLDSIMSRLTAMCETKAINWSSLPSKTADGLTKAKEQNKTEETKKGPKNPMRLRKKPDAIIVKADDVPYNDMLKRIKHNEEVQKVGGNFNKVTMTKARHLKVVLNKGYEEKEKIQEALVKAIGEKAINLKDRSRILISDVDELVTAITAKTGASHDIVIERKSKVGRVVQLVTVSLPTNAAMLIIESKIRIGYVNCRAKIIKEVKKCYEYQGFGHTRSECTEEERSDLCWKYRKHGHRNHDCKEDPKCFLC
jgi:preprotein translocase subunit YajC